MISNTPQQILHGYVLQVQVQKDVQRGPSPSERMLQLCEDNPDQPVPEVERDLCEAPTGWGTTCE